jgi:diguanylate cyclase (GGDEF)-like protein
LKPLLRLLLLLLALGAGAVRGADSPADLIERSRSAMRTDPEASRRLAEQALALLAAAPDADLQVRAHLQLCDYDSERDHAAAQREIDRARALLPRVRRAGLRAGVLLCEGETHQYRGDNVQAMALFQQALAAAEAARDDEMIGEALYQRGYLRGLQGEFANGLADLRRAIAIFERLHLPRHVQSATNSVAILYNRMGDYKQARHYFETSLRQQQAAGFTREQVVTQHNLGRVLENLQDWDAAQRAFESVLALSREIGYRRGEAYALRGLAAVRNARGAPAEAIVLLDRAAQLQRDMPDERLRAQIQLQRGIGLRALQRPADSVAALQQALAIFRKADSMAELVTTHGELARSLTLAGDWRSAYGEQTQFKTLSDAMLQRQLDERFATLRVEFDTAAREQENALLQREKEAAERALAHEQRANRLQAVVLVLVIVLAALLAALAWRQRRASRAMHRLAMTDELTGLPNRRDVLARLDAMLVAARADPVRRCAVLIADIDHFKPINDELGHLAGDEVLRAVAHALREAVREPIAIGRLGGEEFVIVLPDADEAAARSFSERLLAHVRALDVSRWLPHRRVTVSVGIALSMPGDGVSQMLRRADEALYAAKAGGRDRAGVWAAPNDAPAAAVLQAGVS